nr:transglutaminase-like domain-containing protein [Thermococcus sp. 21S7]
MRKPVITSLGVVLLVLLGVLASACIQRDSVSTSSAPSPTVSSLPDGREQETTTTESLDSDGDGLKDESEIYVYKTDPQKADTDGDGLNDGVEVLETGTDPLKSDTDGDGIPDGEEKEMHLNPLSADADNDGISDYDEVFVFNTSPLRADSDSDGLYDPEELSNGTNPLVPDSDGDGLTDGEEVLKFYTDPLVNDTDGDGLLDGVEVETYYSDPLSTDTDHDYLPDGYEVQIGTDPAWDWRYSFDEEAVKAGLSKLLRSRVHGLAESFIVYNSTLDRAWAILEWIDGNIEYNHTKAEYVEEEVQYWDTWTEDAKLRYMNLTRLQAANDTAFGLHSGICGDYAFLTAALLLEANISPVYMLDIDYWNESIGHATVAIKVNGTYLVLDQHLPFIPLGNYYWYSIHNMKKEIENATFYKVEVDENGEIKVSSWTWTGTRLRGMAYTMTEEDVRLVQNLAKQLLVELYPQYKEDARLRASAEADFDSLVESGEFSHHFLPSGFRKGWSLASWRYLGWYYHPVIAKKLVMSYWPRKALEDEDWIEVLEVSDKYYLKLWWTGDKIEVAARDGSSWTVPELLLALEVGS